MNTLDFTRGTWGHNLHAGTWREEEPSGILERIRDRLAGRRRYSVLVHSRVFPKPGDRIRYRVEGGVREATVLEVSQFADPPDMFELVFGITKADDEALEELQAEVEDEEPEEGGFVRAGRELGLLP